MNVDIRIYPKKEMKAIDMGEVLDSVQLANGILQGCTVEIVQNAVHISDGRILIHGRLGVVTAGNVELPTLEGAATCYLAAVCDLAIEYPFYISLLTSADKDALDLKKSRVTDYNAGNGVDYVLLGTVHIDPATGIVSDWTPQNANPVSNKSVVNPLIALIGNVAMGTTATTITGAIRELLTKINTNITNISNAVNRIASLETKTGGIVRTTTYSVAAGEHDYKQLSSLATYILIVNGASTSNNIRGVYLIGCTTSSAIGIKAISAASDVVVESYGNGGLLKVTNNSSSASLRVTLITTFDA